MHKRRRQSPPPVSLPGARAVSSSRIVQSLRRLFVSFLPKCSVRPYSFYTLSLPKFQPIPDKRTRKLVADTRSKKSVVPFEADGGPPRCRFPSPPTGEKFRWTVLPEMYSEFLLKQFPSPTSRVLQMPSFSLSFRLSVPEACI